MQRAAYKKGRLPDDREELLDKLGIRWGVYRDNERSWIKHLAACSTYYDTTGKLPDAYIESEDGLKIGHWLSYQRRRFKKGTMPKERIEAFEKFLGKTWNPKEARWECAFAAYKDYVEKEGKQPERRTIHNGVRIGNWLCNTVRPKKDTLSADQITRLEALGMEWARKRDSTRPSRKALIEESIKKQALSDEWFEFYQHYKNSLIAKESGRDHAELFHKGRHLGAWFQEQWRLLNQGMLTSDKCLLIGKLADFKDFLEKRRRPRNSQN